MAKKTTEDLEKTAQAALSDEAPKWARSLLSEVTRVVVKATASKNHTDPLVLRGDAAAAEFVGFGKGNVGAFIKWTRDVGVRPNRRSKAQGQPSIWSRLALEKASEKQELLYS